MRWDRDIANEQSRSGVPQQVGSEVDDAPQSRSAERGVAGEEYCWDGRSGYRCSVRSLPLLLLLTSNHTDGCLDAGEVLLVLLEVSSELGPLVGSACLREDLKSVREEVEETWRQLGLKLSRTLETSSQHTAWNTFLDISFTTHPFDLLRMYETQRTPSPPSDRSLQQNLLVNLRSNSERKTRRTSILVLDDKVKQYTNNVLGSTVFHRVLDQPILHPQLKRHSNNNTPTRSTPLHQANLLASNPRS